MRIKKIMCLMLLVVMVIQCANVTVYAGDWQTDREGYGNSAQETVYQGEGYSIRYRITDSWDSGYNVSVEIDNISDSTIGNWVLECNPGAEITNIWNATAEKNDIGAYIIKNAVWNMDIASGSKAEFGFAANGSFNGFPEYCRLLKNEQKEYELFNTAYSLYGDWGTGFNAGFTVTNDSDEPVEDWTLEFDYARNITEIWNAEIISHEGNHYVIKNVGHNAYIAPYASLDFGFNGNGGISEDEPLNCIIHGIKAEAGTPAVPGENDSDGTDSGENIPGEPDIPEADYASEAKIVLENLKIGYAGFDSQESVTDNIILPTNANGMEITWTSSNEQIISSDGTVNRPEECSAWVTLTASVDTGETTESCDFRLRAVKTIYDDYTGDDIEIYDEYEYLGLFNSENWDRMYIHENEDGFMDYLIGSYTDMAVDSPDEAILSLSHVKTLLGIESPEEELEWMGTSGDEAIIKFRFQQMHKGIPVDRREVSVITDHDGTTKVLKSSFISGISTDTTPVIDLNTATVGLMDAYTGISSDGLCIYADGEVPELAWLVYGTDISDNEPYRILVSANDGRIICREILMKSGMVPAGEGLEGYQVYYDLSNKKYHLSDSVRNFEVHEYVSFNNNSDYRIKNSSNIWADKNGKGVPEYKNYIWTYDYYQNTFNRKGIDGRNKKVIIYSGDSSLDDAYHNKTSKYDYIYIGESYTNSLKTMVHEYTHGVFDSESNIPYEYVTGAICESYSDIMAQLSMDNPDWTMRIKGNDEIVSEKKSSRKIYNSHSFIKCYESPNIDNDFGYVHQNSTIISNTCYKMYQRGIKKSLLEKLWYTSMIIGYSGADTNFNDVFMNVLASATIHNFSDEDYNMIVKIFNEAGIKDDRKEIIGTSTINGNIVIADDSIPLYDNTSLSGVKVTLLRGTKSQTVESDEDGSYMFANVPNSSYCIVFEKQGYIPTTVEMHVTKSRSRCIIPTVELIPNWLYTVVGTASGYIIDAATGKGVGGLTLEVDDRLNHLLLSGTPKKTVVTRADGYYSIDIFSGNYSVTIKDNRGINGKKYYSDVFNIKVIGEKTVKNQSAIVSDVVDNKGLRVVLEWIVDSDNTDTHPRDVYDDNIHYQVYCSSYHIGSEDCLETIYHENKSSLNLVMHIEINDRVKTYNFYLDYSSSTHSLKDSTAVVKIYYGNDNTPCDVFMLNQAKGNMESNTYWNIFKCNYKTNKIVPINKFVEVLS